MVQAPVATQPLFLYMLFFLYQNLPLWYNRIYNMTTSHAVCFTGEVFLSPWNLPQTPKLCLVTNPLSACWHFAWKHAWTSVNRLPVFFPFTHNINKLGGGWGRARNPYTYKTLTQEIIIINAERITHGQQENKHVSGFWAILHCGWFLLGKEEK